MADLILSSGEFYTLVLGWALCAFSLVLCFLFMFMTPAKAFLKAKMKHCPICLVTHRTGTAEFILGDSKDPGSMDLKDIGPIIQTEGSQVIEKKSKCVMYQCFGESGVSIKKDYPAIVQELREKGFVVNTFDDYKHLQMLATDEKYAQEFKDSTPEDKKAIVAQLIEDIKKVELTIKPWKTYKMHELVFMFPNNISPERVDSKVLYSNNRLIRKFNMNKQWLITGALAGAIIFIGAAIAYKMMAGQGGGETHTVMTGVISAATNSNITM